MPEIVSKPLPWFVPDPNQPRKLFKEDELQRLGASLKVRQIDPTQAMPDGLIIDGERRWRAAKLVNLEKLDVIITTAPLSRAEINVIRLTSVFHRADLSGYEKWLACAELMIGNPTWLMKDLADCLRVDPSLCVRLLSPSKCIEAAQHALRDGLIGISDCYELSKASQIQQVELLKLKLAGASRDALALAGRRTRTTQSPGVRLARVKIALPGGTMVNVCGEDLAMEDVVENLAVTLKEARKAAEGGYDVKTWQKMMADRAKAGA